MPDDGETASVEVSYCGERMVMMRTLLQLRLFVACKDDVVRAHCTHEQMLAVVCRKHTHAHTQSLRASSGRDGCRYRSSGQVLDFESPLYKSTPVIVKDSNDGIWEEARMMSRCMPLLMGL